MKAKKLLFLLIVAMIVFYIVGCKPINLFSPFVDPSLMGNDAKMDAGYVAIANGDYQTAINYFSDVINSSSGDQLTEAYLGRASAYMNEASPNIDDVVADVLNGEIEADDTGAVMSQVVTDGQYDDFFENIENSADDYNSATDNTTGDVDPGILFEAYQANMMAASGVAAKKIAATYNVNPWDGVTEAELNLEYAAILDEDMDHPDDIGTWDTPVTGGLAEFVDDEAEDAIMMEYLTNAYDALKQLKSNPPSAMSESDITNMQSGINSWVTNGLSNTALS
ncbi:MAG: hypothetical protein JSV25_13035 [Spirochaetota bacterium]|nr:MAG: hypothetical protein JSV25_13035 [Spirochaetota bacterium]